MNIPSARTLLHRLRNLNIYLATFHHNAHSDQFEYLMSMTMARMFGLPFYTISNDDANVKYKVIWNGSLSPVRKSPQGPDCLVKACGYNCVVEFTRKTGANQWTQEGAQLARHTDNLYNNQHWDPNHTLTFLITPTISRDTYLHISGSQTGNKQYVLIETSVLQKILETKILAFSINHCELRELFHNIVSVSSSSPNVISFRKEVDNKIKDWKSNALELEKNPFIALKAYEVMRGMGRLHYGPDELLISLQKHPILLQYLKIIGTPLSVNLIKESLTSQKLAKQFTYTFGEILVPVPACDYAQREKQITKKAKEIW